MRERLSHWGLAGLAAMLLVGVSGAAAWADRATTQKNDEAAPSPAVEAPASSPAGSEQAAAPKASHSGALGRVEEILALTGDEQSIYASAMARREQLTDPALTMFLSRMRELPKLSLEQIRSLDQPSVRGLTQRPQQWANVPIQMTVYILKVVKMEPGKDFPGTHWWKNEDGPIWQLACVNPSAPVPANEPIMIFSPIDPLPLLGRPKEIDKKGALCYWPTRLLMVAGVFYKVYDGPDDDGNMREYPVVMAWQIQSPSQGLDLGTVAMDPTVIAISLVLVALVVLYFFIRGRSKQPQSTYLQRKKERLRRRGNEEIEDVPIDPDLKAAAEEARRKEGDANHPGKPGPA